MIVRMETGGFGEVCCSKAPQVGERGVLQRELYNFSALEEAFLLACKQELSGYVLLWLTPRYVCASISFLLRTLIVLG